MQPKDQRHLREFTETYGGGGAVGRGLPWIGGSRICSYRDFGARAYRGCLSYFLYTQITAERYYYKPILRHLLSVLAGEAILLMPETACCGLNFVFLHDSGATLGR